jgi:hypothetical protein
MVALLFIKKKTSIQTKNKWGKEFPNLWRGTGEGGPNTTNARPDQTWCGDAAMLKWNTNE